MTDILQLPGWEATGTRTEQGEFIIEAKYTVPATSCIKCGVVCALYRHGTKKVRLRDSPVRGLDTVKAVIGNVPVVIDKFHVVRMANQAVDKVRIRVQKEKDAKTRVAWKRSKVQLVLHVREKNPGFDWEAWKP